MGKAKRKLKAGAGFKAAVFIGGLIVSLTALELGLRLTGYAIASGREREFVPPYDEKAYDSDYTFERYRSGGGRLILTFGDSLTNGGNVRSYDSYPYNLYKKFADAGTKAAVYNMGYCEDSTFGVADKLKNYLNNEDAGPRPDAVVILVGAADLFNLPLVKEGMMRDDSFWHDMLPKGWFYSLRLYKVYRHIKMSLVLKSAQGDSKADRATAEEKLKLLLEAYADYKKSPRYAKRLGLDPLVIARLNPYFAKEMAQFDLDLASIPDLMEFLSDYGSLAYTPRLRYDKFFGLLLDLAETFPEEFWNNYFDAAGYHFFQIYQVQSRYTAGDVARVLDKSEQAHPNLAGNEALRTFRRVLADREEMDRYVDRKRMQAWDEIAALAKAKNVKLVLQNYPVQYQSANRIIEAVAKKHQLPLVDNRRLFTRLIKEHGRGKFLEDNDHMTPEGYRRLAGNVFGKLSKVLSK